MCGLGLKLQAPPFLEDKLNDSTFALIKRSLNRLNRHRLLRSHLKLMCFECKAMRCVMDYFASGESLLDCQHRRPAFFLDTKVAEEFEAEVAERKIRREIVGFCQPTAGGHIRRFEELSEDAA